MLVLSRRVGEKIQIGNNIEVIVVDISRNRIQLGVNCPLEIPVHREEVFQRISASRKPVSQAADANSDLCAVGIPSDRDPFFVI